MKIEHVAIFVNDLDKSKDFFVKYFGAEAGEEYHNPTTDFRSYFLSFDGGSRLEIMFHPQMKDSFKDMRRTGYDHMAISVGSKEAVDEITSRMKADGVKVMSPPRTTGDGYYESTVMGPEGNLVEITA